MKRQYTGTDITIGYDNTFDSDVAKRRIDATGGFSLEGGRTSVLWSVGYADSNELLEEDRNFSQQGRDLLFRNNPERILSTCGLFARTLNICSRDGSELILDDGTPLGSSITFVPIGYPGPGSDGGAAFVQNAGQFNLELSNDAFGKKNSLASDPVTSSASLSIQREFTPWVEGFLDAAYYSNEGHVNRGFLGGFAFLDGDAPTNPFTNTILVAVPSPDPARPIPTRSETDSLQAVIGTTIKLPREWGIQAEYSWGESESSFSNFSASLMPSFRSALTSGEIDILRDLNAFPIDVSEFAYTEPTTTRGPAGNTLSVFSLRASGPSIKLPAGPIQTAILLEHRIDENDSSLGGRTSFSSGRRTFSFSPPSEQITSSAYVEGLLPIISDDNGLPLARELEVQIAARYDRVETTLPDIGAAVILSSLDDPIPAFGFNTTDLSSTNYTVGLRYVPVEGLLIRASAATGFLPPSLDDLRLSIIQTSEFPSFVHSTPDPKRGGVGENNILPIEVTSGGNPGLDPEESDSYSFGIILTPSFIPGLRLSADYTFIEKSGEIIDPSFTDILLFEDQLPGRVTRAPLTSEDEAQGFTGGEIVEINGTLLNFAESAVEAYDLQLSYLKVADNWGTFDFYAVATLQTTLESQILPTAPTIDTVGFLSGPLEWRGNAGLIWNNGPWTLGWNMQYYDSYKIYRASDSEARIETAILNQGSSKVASQTYHDVFATVQLGEVGDSRSGIFSGTELRLGVQNVFDREPPIIATNAFGGGSGYSTYGDPRLRRYSIQLRKSF